MRVLAVDPGLTRCGVGVVDGLPGRRLTLVEVGVIRTLPADPTPRRLVAVDDELHHWFERHRPEAVAIERVFADTNVSTVMGTAQVTGLVMVHAERRGLPVTLHTPTEVKAAVSGSGRADKAQVTTMVTRLLGLTTPPKPADAADALALAICHVWRGGTQNRLAEAAAAAPARPSRIPTRVPRSSTAVTAHDPTRPTLPKAPTR
ncbi:crossover junction endodeoxyribonuclease RuvC [Terracoccus luteus]|uniref:Crossover junction endodeoxyribonuclease RuvC n=1 Tax=Terracoccus luteus TaxID=53356 RepID=A0A839Q6A9_9MICO|nr:crossover junction endodeoxyribonuclease RuvC [Terracoccus luteus]MBB2988181.1 crossover junction endodeoxyribonuclease RuvC [Terracoccus luteus]MCP2173816.1 crossover junction endodeoxyribonuclease RuvC [Terracoccus luteus]